MSETQKPVHSLATAPFLIPFFGHPVRSHVPVLSRSCPRPQASLERYHDHSPRPLSASQISIARIASRMSLVSEKASESSPIWSPAHLNMSTESDSDPSPRLVSPFPPSLPLPPSFPSGSWRRRPQAELSNALPVRRLSSLNSQNVFRNSGLKTTNLHCVILRLRFQTLLPSKTRFSFIVGVFRAK